MTDSVVLDKKSSPPNVGPVGGPVGDTGTGFHGSTVAVDGVEKGSVSLKGSISLVLVTGGIQGSSGFCGVVIVSYDGGFSHGSPKPNTVQ